MTQRTVFTREMIVDAAFQLTRAHGWAFVTARTIAEKLGSSTIALVLDSQVHGGDREGGPGARGGLHARLPEGKSTPTRSC